MAQKPGPTRPALSPAARFSLCLISSKNGSRTCFRFSQDRFPSCVLRKFGQRWPGVDVFFKRFARTCSPVWVPLFQLKVFFLLSLWPRVESLLLWLPRVPPFLAGNAPSVPTGLRSSLFSKRKFSAKLLQSAVCFCRVLPPPPSRPGPLRPVPSVVPVPSAAQLLPRLPSCVSVPR